MLDDDGILRDVCNYCDICSFIIQGKQFGYNITESTCEKCKKNIKSEIKNDKIIMKNISDLDELRKKRRKLR